MVNFELKLHTNSKKLKDAGPGSNLQPSAERQLSSEVIATELRGH